MGLERFFLIGFGGYRLFFSRGSTGRFRFFGEGRVELLYCFFKIYFSSFVDGDF